MGTGPGEVCGCNRWDGRRPGWHWLFKGDITKAVEGQVVVELQGCFWSVYGTGFPPPWGRRPIREHLKTWPWPRGVS